MRVAFLTFVLLSFSPWAAGQHDCPEGFSYVNTLSGTGSESNPFDQRLAVKFPENATLDESFQQKKGTCHKRQEWRSVGPARPRHTERCAYHSLRKER